MTEKLSPATRAQYISELREIYDEYQARRKSLAARIEAEVIRQMEAAEGDLLRDLSKIVHEYYSKGLSKMGLREATRKYGNAGEFAKIWDAYLPDDETSLGAGRRSAQGIAKENAPYVLHRDEDGNLTGLLDVIRDHNGQEIEPILTRYFGTDSLDFQPYHWEEDFDRTVEIFGGIREAWQNFKGMLRESTRETGDYDEMLAWAKAVKK